MSDLAAFLTARLDEDEEYLRVVVGSIPYQRATAEQATPSAELRAAVVALMSRPDLQALSARWADSGVRPPNDLARALGEVAAKRAILAEHAEHAGYCQRCSPDSPDPVDGYWTRWPCSTVRTLAAVYSDHPDYDPAWAPR